MFHVLKTKRTSMGLQMYQLKKTAALILVLYAVLLATSCSSPSKKFTGKWRPVSSVLTGDVTPITIKKSGDHYDIASESLFANLSELHYNKKEDCLTGDAGGITIAVKYNKVSKHINIGPKNIDLISQFMEFEKFN